MCGYKCGLVDSGGNTVGYNMVDNMVVGGNKSDGVHNNVELDQLLLVGAVALHTRAVHIAMTVEHNSYHHIRRYPHLRHHMAAVVF